MGNNNVSARSEKKLNIDGREREMRKKKKERKAIKKPEERKQSIDVAT